MANPYLEYFAVLPDVLPGGRVVLPDQPPVVEVLRLRPPGHSGKWLNF